MDTLKYYLIDVFKYIIYYWYAFKYYTRIYMQYYMHII